MLTIDRRADAPDGGLVLSLTVRDLVTEAGATSFGAALQSRPGDVTLVFGPSRQVDHWPALACRHATYGADGASLTLRLDPGVDPPMPGRLSAFTLDGRSERCVLSAILTALSAPLDAEAARDGDLRLKQAAELVATLADVIEDGRALDGTPPEDPPLAAKPALFAPSFWGRAEVDDVLMSEGWSQLRLGYGLPRLNGFWTKRATWRVFHAGLRFGLEFRTLEGDRSPIDLSEAADVDEHGPVVRAEMRLDDPFVISPSMVRLHPDQRAMVVAIARQTALDLPLVFASSRHPLPFSRERWRHWSRMLPDVLARMPPDA